MKSKSPVNAPLLPKSADDGSSFEFAGGASVSGAVFNVSTSIIGAGIMSIPAAVKVLGVVPSLFLIAAVALLADSSVEFMLRYTGWAPVASPRKVTCADVDAPVMSYAAIMRDAFGSAGAVSVNLGIALTTAGTLVVYLIIIGDVLSGTGSHAGILPEWFGPQWWNGREVALLLITVLVLLPLVLVKRVDSLRHTSALSILLAVVFMFITSGIAFYSLFRGTAKRPRLFPDFNQLSSPFELCTAVPVIVVAFTFHFNVHPIRAELSKTSDMTKAVRFSLVLCSFVYAAIGFFGYLLFGDETTSDILSNFDSSSGSSVPQIVNDLVRLSYALHLILVFPILLFSLRINIDELLFHGRRALSSDNLRFLSLTGVLMVFIYLAAIAIPNIWILFQFSGSTSAVCVSLIFPAAMVLRDVHNIATRKDKTLAAAMVTLAAVTSIIAISSNINTYINSS